MFNNTNNTFTSIVLFTSLLSFTFLRVYQKNRYLERIKEEKYLKSRRVKFNDNIQVFTFEK